MFLYTLIQTSLQPRQEIDVKSLVADFIKMLFCNLLITQAVNIVSGIFTFGTRLARIVVGASGTVVTDPNRGIGDNLVFAEGYEVHILETLFTCIPVNIDGFGLS